MTLTTINNRSRRRNNYSFTVKQKIQIVRMAYRIPNNVRKTAIKLGMSRDTDIRKWKKNLPRLIEKARINPHARTTSKGPSVSDPVFEKEIKDWIMEQRSDDILVRTKDIINFTIQSRPDYKNGVEKTLVSWVYKFLARNNLSVRRVTRVGQKLSGHLKEVKDDCCQALRQRMDVGGTLHGLDPHFFINMDQTAVYYEMKSSTTVDVVGKNTISCRDSGSNSKRVTVVLSVAADGTKLPPFVVFKGRPGGSIENEISKNNWLACVQEKGWFDCRVGKIWIDKILKPYVADADQSLLLVDHFSVHLSSAFVHEVNELGCDVEYIPAGYTCVLQPVDVGVNAPFKSSLRDFHHQWCLQKYPIIKDNKLPTPDRSDIYEWIQDSFGKVSNDSIKKLF